MSELTTDRLVIEGSVAPGFEPVREVFERNFTDDIEIGASFCAIVGGETVVDLWGGFRDRECSEPWRQDTLVNVYSTTKGLAAAAVAVAVDEGLLDYQAKVTRYWPEFGRHGKDALTVGQLLSHQGGVCGLRQPIIVEDLYDWEKMTRLLAEMEPWWTPGEGAGYHAVTWGYLPGELIRRTAGMTLGQYFRSRVAEPAGADGDCYIGLPESEMDRCAVMIGPNHARSKPGAAEGSGPVVMPQMPRLYPVALQNPVIRPFQDASSRNWRAAEIAAANGQANARGIARVYVPFACGGECRGRSLVSAAAIAAATRQEVADQNDLVLGMPMRRGRGFILNTPPQYGPEATSFGHSGAGGSFGFADPVRQIAFGYAMNQMQPGLEADTRGGRLVRAVYQAVGRP